MLSTPLVLPAGEMVARPETDKCDPVARFTVVPLLSVTVAMLPVKVQPLAGLVKFNWLTDPSPVTVEVVLVLMAKAAVSFTPGTAPAGTPGVGSRLQSFGSAKLPLATRQKNVLPAIALCLRR